VNTVVGALFRTPDRYAMVALAMVAAVVIGGWLAFRGTFEDTIFWLEATLILLFAAFWILQTKERWDRDHPHAESTARASARADSQKPA
jgi:hypothetical protein